MGHRSTSAPRRLGLNRGRYEGDGIDFRSERERASALARRHGWRSETIWEGEDESIDAYSLGSLEAKTALYISSGIHGDEPAGALAAVALLERAWPSEWLVTIVPFLNPSGLARNQRENRAGVDLNRRYRDQAVAEVEAHCRWMEGRPRFNLAICLHEDWESAGFYIYEVNPKGERSLARATLDAVGRRFPIDRGEKIDGYPARDGLICPRREVASMPEWPEAVWLAQERARLVYTLETSSDFDLKARTSALVVGVEAMTLDFEA